MSVAFKKTLVEIRIRVLMGRFELRLGQWLKCTCQQPNMYLDKENRSGTCRWGWRKRAVLNTEKVYIYIIYVLYIIPGNIHEVWNLSCRYDIQQYETERQPAPKLSLGLRSGVGRTQNYPWALCEEDGGREGGKREGEKMKRPVCLCRFGIYLFFGEVFCFCFCSSYSLAPYV